MKIYRFLDFQIDTFERKLIKSGKTLKVSPKAFDVLQILIERSGSAVSKEEIISDLWPGTFVEESNIAVHVSLLRKVLGATEENPIIESAHGVGYRFICRVKEIAEAENDHLRTFQPISLSKQLSDKDSIAVLPFTGSGENPDIEYLAEGLTESFINELANIADIRVISRDAVYRYKESDIEAFEIGRKLSVNKVLTGRVKLIKEHYLLVSAELINVADNTHLWGGHYHEDFSEVFEIQGKIISGVTQNLVSLIKESVETKYLKLFHGNEESYLNYLKASFYLSKQDRPNILKAIPYFHKSLQLYPENSLACAGLIDAYTVLYGIDQIDIDEARKRVDEFILLSNGFSVKSPRLESSKGLALMWIHWDFAAAEQHFLNCLNLEPNSRVNINRYVNLLISLGRFEEAYIQVKKLIEVQDFLPKKNQLLAKFFFRANDKEKAIFYIKEALELDPGDTNSRATHIILLAESGHYEEALAEIEKAIDDPFHWEMVAMKGYTYAKMGNKELAREILQELDDAAKSEIVPSVYQSHVCIALEEIDRAFEYLEKGLEKHTADLTTLKSDPRWLPIKNDPRYKELLKKVGLPLD